MFKAGFLFVLSFELIVFSFILFPKGMFVDGLTYASISSNLSEGIGTIWQPHYTQHLSPDFYGHPPLSFILQSWFFTILGDYLWVERLYSFLTFFFKLLIIKAIWNILPGKKENYWTPMILWIICGSVFWSYSNNLIENTNALFISGVIFFFIKSCISQQSKLLVIVGLLCFLSLLTKGPFGLFVLVTPILYHLLFKTFPISNLVKAYSIILLSFLTPLLFVLLLSQETQDFFQNYISQQLVNGVQNEVTVESRWFIILRFIKNCSPILILSSIIGFIYRKKISLNPFIFLLFLIALSGVFPVMISFK